MMLYDMKIYVLLLWGLCVVFSVESMTTSRQETSLEIAVKLNSTTRSTTAHVTEPQSATLNSLDRYAEVNSASAALITLLPTVATVTSENSKANGSNSNLEGLVTMITAAGATISSKSPGLTAETTAKNEAQPSLAVTTAASKAQSSPAVTTAPDTAQPSHNMETTDATKTASNQSHQQSTQRLMTTAATDSTVFAGAVSVSSPRVPPTYPESTSELTSTSSSEMSTQEGWHFIQNTRRPTSSTATNSANTTSEGAPYHYPSKVETSTSAEHTSPSHLNSATSSHISSSQFPDTAGSHSTSADSHSSTVPISNSSAGIFFPQEPKKSPIPKTRSAPATTAAPNEVSKSPATIEAQPCSSRGVVKQCLLVIAVLAAVATIFMVSTIVLCTKLSARKYKMRRPQQATEMMCISSLLPDRTHTYARQRNPITNGVLVFPGGGDSDEDGGDNLTLSSFLPENDRYV